MKREDYTVFILNNYLNWVWLAVRAQLVQTKLFGNGWRLDNNRKRYPYCRRWRKGWQSILEPQREQAERWQFIIKCWRVRGKRTEIIWTNGNMNRCSRRPGRLTKLFLRIGGSGSWHRRDKCSNAKMASKHLQQPAGPRNGRGHQKRRW